MPKLLRALNERRVMPRVPLNVARKASCYGRCGHTDQASCFDPVPRSLEVDWNLSPTLTLVRRTSNTCTSLHLLTVDQVW
jgi:hypothetical protein